MLNTQRGEFNEILKNIAVLIKILNNVEFKE
jgi:hypothetical protein